MNTLANLKKVIAAVAVCSLFLTSSTANAAIDADILWLIDVSGSMGPDIDSVRTRIGQFETAMNDNGINASYGLIEFGGNVSGTDDWAIVTDMTNNFVTFQAGLNSITANHGNPEAGSSATLFGLNNITWTSGSVKNLILVTDEDDDSTLADFNAANTGLTDERALFNFIGVPGVGNTNDRYGVLASGHGGTAFSITSFRNDPDPFFEHFIDTKVEEIQSQVPEPSTLVIWSLLGICGIILHRRRKA